MVQRKVSYKHSIQPKHTIKTDNKKHVTPQNYDAKALRMKKSRSMKRSTDLEFVGHPTTKSHLVPPQQGEAPDVVTPTKTPPNMKRLGLEFGGGSTTKSHLVPHQQGEAPDVAIPTKTTPNMKRPGLEFGAHPTTKSHLVPPQQREAPDIATPTKTPPNMKRLGLAFGGGSTRKNDSPPTVTPTRKTSPNYMKSTNSSELHKVGKTSSLNKVRRLTKSPSFKHTRTTGSRKKAVLCDAQKPTCSSTLKEYKFPSYLKLTHGATEAEGTSVMKVCPYTYCSLNGHRHNSAPPLKSFLASRRRVSAPCKRKRNENKVTEDDEFFVEIHVPVISEEPRKQGSSECDYNASECELETDSESSCQVSDMEWEEGGNLALDGEKDYGGDGIEPGFELEKFIEGKLLPYIYDEIMECLQFSDADTISDSEASQTDGEDYIVEQTVDDETICTAMVKEGSIEGKDGAISNPIEEAQHESLEFYKYSEENGDDLDKVIYLLEDTGEEDKDVSDIVMEETKPSEFLVEDLPWEARNYENIDLEDEIPVNSENSQAEADQSDAKSAEDESLLNSNNSQAEVDQTEEESTEDESLSTVNECPQPTDENDHSSVEVAITVIKAGSSSGNSEEDDSNEVKLESIDVNLAEEVKESNMEDISVTEKEEALPININEAAQVRKCISKRANDSLDELLDCQTKLKKSSRSNKTKDDNEEERDFNPRPPNFLPVEPEPEAEKVDLRHQDMDERRDAQDWMLDHALQKTVNQLGQARKRKVSLLVEAFEAVLPVPKYEPRVRRNLSGFAHTRPVQACR